MEYAIIQFKLFRLNSTEIPDFCFQSGEYLDINLSPLLRNCWARHVPNTIYHNITQDDQDSREIRHSTSYNVLKSFQVIYLFII